jgi:hypothetical protein
LSGDDGANLVSIATMQVLVDSTFPRSSCRSAVAWGDYDNEATSICCWLVMMSLSQICLYRTTALATAAAEGGVGDRMICRGARRLPLGITVGMNLMCYQRQH